MHRAIPYIEAILTSYIFLLLQMMLLTYLLFAPSPPSTRHAENGCSLLSTFWGNVISHLNLCERRGPEGRSPPEKMGGPGGRAPRASFNP